MRAEVSHIGARVRAAIGRFLDAPDMDRTVRHPLDADDLLTMVKGMVDAAGQRGEHDAQALQRRVERAAFGYLAARMEAS